MYVDKSNPKRKELCVTCKHEHEPQDANPCNCCWNPIGDMSVHKDAVPYNSKVYTTCECCKGTGRIEVTP